MQKDKPFNPHGPEASFLLDCIRDFKFLILGGIVCVVWGLAVSYIATQTYFPYYNEGYVLTETDKVPYLVLMGLTVLVIALPIYPLCKMHEDKPHLEMTEQEYLNVRLQTKILEAEASINNAMVVVDQSRELRRQNKIDKKNQKTMNLSSLDLSGNP
jgi:hypothetical protein